MKELQGGCLKSKFYRKDYNESRKDSKDFIDFYDTKKAQQPCL
jgi:hypothetical protein